MFYVYHGEDEFSRSEEVAQRKQQVMAAGMGDLNITELDGRRLTFEELVNACQAVPFLAERRLVIVHDLLQRFDGARAARGRRAATDGARAVSTADAAFAEQLVAYLPHMPPSTRLVFVDAKALNASNPVLKAAQRSKDGFIKLFTVPEGRALDNWVRERAQQHGAPITPQATELLTAAVGANLRQLDRELAKLAAYANYARDISAEDVRTLVQATRESDIFGLVDSLGARRREEALRHLEELLADPDAHELYILTMIARQVRLILAAKELAEEQGQGVDAVQRELRLSRRFIAEKVISQARMFRMEELEALLRRVAELDQAIKTGQIEGPLGLEMLIVESCRQGARRQGRPPAPRRATRRQPSRKAARTREGEPRRRPSWVEAGRADGRSRGWSAARRCSTARLVIGSKTKTYVRPYLIEVQNSTRLQVPLPVEGQPGCRRFSASRALCAGPERSRRCGRRSAGPIAAPTRLPHQSERCAAAPQVIAPNQAVQQPSGSVTRRPPRPCDEVRGASGGGHAGHPQADVRSLGQGAHRPGGALGFQEQPAGDALGPPDERIAELLLARMGVRPPAELDVDAGRLEAGVAGEVKVADARGAAEGLCFGREVGGNEHRHGARPLGPLPAGADALEKAPHLLGVPFGEGHAEHVDGQGGAAQGHAQHKGIGPHRAIRQAT